jgi:hypothetical protein
MRRLKDSSRSIALCVWVCKSNKWDSRSEDAEYSDHDRRLADSEMRESQKAQGNQREDKAQLCTHEKEDEEH